MKPPWLSEISPLNKFYRIIPLRSPFSIPAGHHHQQQQEQLGQPTKKNIITIIVNKNNKKNNKDNQPTNQPTNQPNKQTVKQTNKQPNKQTNNQQQQVFLVAGFSWRGLQTSLVSFLGCFRFSESKLAGGGNLHWWSFWTKSNLQKSWLLRGSGYLVTGYM